VALPKNYNEFKSTVHLQNPPEDWPVSLQALWWDSKGDWHRAHELADGIIDTIGFWIHGYLHRVEGDIFNAHYWYSRANKTLEAKNLEVERKEIINSILKK